MYVCTNSLNKFLGKYFYLYQQKFFTLESIFLFNRCTQLSTYYLHYPTFTINTDAQYFECLLTVLYDMMIKSYSSFLCTHITYFYTLLLLLLQIYYFSQSQHPGWGRSLSAGDPKTHSMLC